MKASPGTEYLRQDSWAERQTALGSILFLLLAASALLVLGCAAGLALPLYNGFPKRLAPFLNALLQVRGLLWLLLLVSGSALGGLLVRFRGVYRRPGWLAGNLARSLQFLFVRRALFWLALAVVLTAAVMLYPYAPRQADRVPAHDSGIFLYFGQQILKGQLPYRDLWDHKPPLVFYINALGLWGGSMWGVWALEVLSLSAASLLGLLTLRRVYGSGPAFVAVTAMQAGLVFMLEGGNLTEEYALPFQFLALYLFLVRGLAEEKDGSRWSAFWIGAAFGAALMLKQTLVGVWVAIFLWMAFRMIWAVRRGTASPLRSGRSLLWMAAGALAVLGLVAVYFAANGALDELWDVAFLYNFNYSDVEGEQRLNALQGVLAFLTQTSGFFVVGLVSWVVGGVYLYLHRADLTARVVLPTVALLALGWIDLLVELVLSGISALNYRHYFMSLLPGLTCLAAFGAAQLVGLSQRLAGLPQRLRGRIPGRALGIVSLAVLWIGMVNASLPVLVKAWNPRRDVSINLAVQYIRARTAPDDQVLLWGSQVVVNYLSNRAAPTRYVHAKPLFREGYSSPAVADELLADLEREKPRLIIDTGLSSAPFVQVGPDGECIPPASAYPAWIGPVYAHICAHYARVDVIGKDAWNVWQLK